MSDRRARRGWSPSARRRFPRPTRRRFTPLAALLVTLAVGGSQLAASPPGRASTSPPPARPTARPASTATARPASTATARPASTATARPASTATARAEDALRQGPVTFVENQGQLDAAVDYSVPGADTAVYFTPTGVTYALTDHGGGAAGKKPSRWAVKVDFVGAAPVHPVASDPTGGVVSYFTGPAAGWHAGLRAFTTLVYHDLWPGIDLVYGGSGGRLKYSFHVAPGADPSAIRLAVRGATAVSIDGAGRLVAATPAGDLVDEAPSAYQTAPGNSETPVGSAFALQGTTAGDGSQTVGFALETYDRTRPLVIDPAVVVSSGFIGGVSQDAGNAIAVNGTGNVYVVGRTFSPETSFPATVGPDTTFDGVGGDAFIVKVNPAGTGFLYAGYVDGTDEATGVAVDAAGEAFVTGTATTGGVTGFPAVGTLDPTPNGGVDTFVLKVNSSGTAIDYAGFIGGTGNDSAEDIAVDSGGNAYVTGSTTSGDLPTTVGPDLTYGGVTDAFVAKVNPTGSGLVYCGYIGGADEDQGHSIAVDSANAAYVVGQARSDQSTFPVSVGPDLTFNGGPSQTDGFVAKVDPTGTSLNYAGYIGGSGDDRASAVAVDPATGAAYVTGSAGSGTGFPVVGGLDSTFNGNGDAFVAEVAPGGASLVYSGFIGGAGGEGGEGIAVDTSGRATVVGSTGSDEGSFPVANGPDSTYNGKGDVFIARVNGAGSALDYAGYIGGAGSESFADVALDASGDAWVTGEVTDAAGFPATGGPDTSFNGAEDAFLTHVSVVSAPSLSGVSVQASAPPGPHASGIPFDVTVVVTNDDGTSPATGVALADVLGAGLALGPVNPSQGSCTPAGATVNCTLGTLLAGATATVVITVTPQTTGPFTSVATVTATSADPFPGNNQDAINVDVRDVDLVVTQSPSRNPARAGSPLTYTVHVVNTGSDTSGAATITDTLPAGSTFGSAIADRGPGCTELSGVVTCTVPFFATLADDTDSAQLNITVTVTPPAGPPITNTVVAAAAPVPDANPADNTSSLTIDVVTITPVDNATVSSVPPGNTVSTNPAVSAANPVATSVTTSTAGPTGDVKVDEFAQATTTPPSGFSLLNFEVDITAPPAPDDAHPLTLVFRIAGAVVPAGVDATNLAVLRDGVVVADCTGTPGTASPDPCISSRAMSGADIVITVLSSHASTWNFAVTAGAGDFLFSLHDKEMLPAVGGGTLTVQNEDVVRFVATQNAYELVFDGSRVGLGRLAIDALAVLPDGDLVLSFASPGKVPGLGKVDDSDLVRFHGTLGPATSGTFSVYLDGSDIGLTKNGENIDAVEIRGGDLYLSTTGDFSARSGHHRASGHDEDVFVCSGVHTGRNSSCAGLSVPFEGSDAHLTRPGEDIDALSADASGRAVFSTTGAYSVPGASGGPGDLFACPGDIAACDQPGTVFTTVFVAADHHLEGNITALELNLTPLGG